MNLPENQSTQTLAVLTQEFTTFLGVQWCPPIDLKNDALKLVAACGGQPHGTEGQRLRFLLRQINRKFKLNNDGLRAILDHAARWRIFPNVHEKNLILDALDAQDEEAFKQWAFTTSRSDGLAELFAPLSEADTLARFREIYSSPKVNRSDAKPRTLEESQEQFLRSLYGAYVFDSLPREKVHCFFDPSSCSDYRQSYFDHLLIHNPQLLRRDYALSFLTIDEGLVGNEPYEDIRERICSFIQRTYEELSNHSYLAIRIDPLGDGIESNQWKLYADIVLFAEKHRNVKLARGYFNADRVRRITQAHIPHLSAEDAAFDTAQEGFFYKDCFVLTGDPVDKQGKHYSPISLLLVFEKNERDETVLPCPACRSSIVSGNSYSSLGVKSWECRNSLCPERSAFDRGNRYSLVQLLRQQAIFDQRNIIPKECLTRWKLDMVQEASTEQIAEMLLRHFSLAGDTVRFVNYGEQAVPSLDRHVTLEPLLDTPGTAFDDFAGGPFFRRFMCPGGRDAELPPSQSRSPLPGVHIVQGDSKHVLGQMDSNCFDGATTSPPYYNAREYSTWPNIYCYLHDMAEIAREVFRTLRAGAYYLFNIFDYFDNEKIVVDSAMGNKRMILGAYITHIFREVGFEVCGNVAWFKGEIEGKRNYNQGNNSPFYQLPLNAWEHVLVFRKPGDQSRLEFPTVLRATPVIKMIRGVNTLGHTAPYPEEVPALLLDLLPRQSLVLDPFGGSMTTCRAAIRRNIRSVGIDLHAEYCELGAKLVAEGLTEGQPSFSF